MSKKFFGFGFLIIELFSYFMNVSEKNPAFISFLQILFLFVYVLLFIFYILSSLSFILNCLI